jgi:lysophospholipase L1-like esterase
LNAIEADITTAMVPRWARVTLQRIAFRTRGPLNATFAKIEAGRIGSLWLFFGDSNTLESITPDNAYWAQAFAVQAALLSKGQIIMDRNAGVPGNTTAQMDARFESDVKPYAAQVDMVFLLAGTNDSAVTPMATWIASKKSIIAKIRALGKQPIMATIPPNNNAAPPRPAAITQQNAWIRRYAGQNSIPLVDFYKALVDPVTGGFLPGYNTDATHPAAPGRAAMATALVNTLQPLLSPAPVIIPQDNKDPNNLLTNGCFVDWSAPVTVPAVATGTVATGGALAAGTYFYKVTVLNYQGESLPSAEVSVTITAGQQPELTITNPGGQRVLNIYRSTAAGAEVLLAANVAPAAYPASTVWADAGALTPGTQTPPTQDYTSAPTGWGSTTGGPAKLSKVADPAFQGYAARFTATGAQHGQTQTIAMAGKYSVGDTLALVGVLRSGGQVTNVSAKFNGGAAPNTFTVLGDPVSGSPGVYYREVVVPAGTTSLSVYFQNDSSATGSADFGQLGVYNLTALGIL